MPQQPNSRQAHIASRDGSKRVIQSVSTEHHQLNRPGQQPPKASSAPPAKPPGPRVNALPLDDIYDNPHQAQPAPQPESKPQAERSSQYQTVGLPSGFRFYPFKELSVRPLKGMDQAKLHQAATQNSIRHTVEAISATLGDGVSALDLTPQDFYYLMYWQRTQSFLKTPMIVKASCTDPTHNEHVIMGKPGPTEDSPRIPVDEKTLELSIHVDRTTLDVKDLEITEQEGKYELLDGIELHVETMRDIVYAAEHLVDLADLAEAEWLAGYAAFLTPLLVPDSDSGEGRPENLLERMERVKELSPDQLAELDEYIREVTSYGVSESTTIKCPECGASNEVVIPFDARTFLPHIKRG